MARLGLPCAYFQNAGKLPELAAVLDQADLDGSGLSQYVQLLVTMIDRPASRAVGLQLLLATARKPGYPRGTIMAALGSGRVTIRSNARKTFDLPELYDILRDEIVPQPTETTLATWSGIDPHLRAFLIGAAKQNHLSELAEAVGRATALRPDWAGGKALLTLIDVHRGLYEKARAGLIPLIESTQSLIPTEVRRVLVRELEGAPELSDLALRLVEAEGDTKLANGVVGYQGSLTRIHVNLYRSAISPRRASWQ